MSNISISLEQRRKQKRDWYHRNKEAVKKQRQSERGKQVLREYYIRNKLKLCMHQQVYSFLKRLRQDKDKRTQEYLGYTIEDLEKHLESTFEEGMTWDNYGEWHIDHVIPKSQFNENQIRECFALSNLQAMWGRENSSKGNRYIGKYKKDFR
jgi:hypothetical protein